MDDLQPELRTYHNLKVEDGRVDGYSIVTVEVPDLREGRYARHHQRIIGGPKTPADGRTIIYADTYAEAPRAPTYAYARHDVDQEAFFTLLEGFIGAAILVDFPELRNKTARCVIQTRENLRQVDFESYLTAVTSLKSTPLQFARLYFVFGDMTVEFKPKPSLIKGELDFVSRGVLPRAVESPLFAFDVSRSDIWLSFLMSVHWARNLFPVSVLRSIVGMAAPAVVT
jgi:hypothetical protein